MNELHSLFDNLRFSLLPFSDKNAAAMQREVNASPGASHPHVTAATAIAVALVTLIAAAATTTTTTTTALGQS